MNIHPTRIALAVALALSGTAVPVFAQSAPAPAAAPPQPVTTADATLETIQVVGIRASEEKSLAVKRDSDNFIEVITAEDVGKMPDKNIADSLARVPGLNTSAAGANEGGFDENDRVSMRGTNPSLTQTLINGHNVAAGDWFVLNQTGTVGRSVSYTLLPSELVSQVQIHKSSDASLVEGGVAGSVDIITRKPLDIAKPLAVELSAGVVYADLPSKTDPQLSGLVNWHNDENSFGVLLQAFSQTRHLRRDGVELLGYDTIGKNSPLVTGQAATATLPFIAPHPDLAGVQYPTMIGAALFEQKRERNGGMLDLQWKPNDDVNLDLSGFLSNVNAPNYNRNFLLWNTHFLNSGNGIAPDPGYVVANNTLVKANFTGSANAPGTAYGIYDQISRPDEKENSNFVNLDGAWRVNAKLKLDGQLGTSHGNGRTPTQNVSETNPGVGTGGGWQLNGIGSAPNFNLGTNNNTTPFPGGVPVAFNWIFGAQDVEVKDKENWVKIDGQYKLDDAAPVSDIKFGIRHESHDRTSLGAIAQGPTAAGQSTAHYPTTWSTYPSNFNSFGGSIPTGIWYWTPDQLAAYDGPGFVQRDPTLRAYPDYWFEVHEKTDAAFVEAEASGSNWSGNAGVRFVSTKEDTVIYENDSSVTASTPGAVTTSLFGPYVARPVNHTYNNILPSANLKLDVARDLVARFAIAQTMTRPDYSSLAGATSLNSPPQLGTPTSPATPGSGSTGNQDLKPVTSTNLDAGIEWYFARQSLLSATLFSMNLHNYVSYGSLPLTALTYSGQYPAGQALNYIMTVPINAAGHVHGLELAYQQELTRNFGINGNYTYANAKQTSNVTNGDDRLVGTSKNTYNISGYFENDMFSARVTYTYRSAFYSGLDRSTAFTQDSIGNLGASLGYTIMQNLSATLDAENLNNPTLKYYALNETQPRAFYTNGRQYYLNLRYKF